MLPAKPVCRTGDVGKLKVTNYIDGFPDICERKEICIYYIYISCIHKDIIMIL